MVFTDLADAYLDDPSAEHLDDLRAAILAAPNFDPDLNAVRVAEPLLLREAYVEVVDTLGKAMPGAFLNPATHLALAQAYAGSGDERLAQRETAVARRAVEGILGTGDGSVERPWTVLRVADEYDVLRALGKRPTGQTYVRREGRALDHLALEDGEEAWFEVLSPARRAS